MKRNTPYSAYVSTHYGSVAPATTESYRRRYYVWKSYFVPLLPVDKNSAILEIGCGVGHNLYALKELGYANIEGTDYSGECIDICKNRGYRAHQVNEQSEKTYYWNHRQRFDCIILYDVLEHYRTDDAQVLLGQVKSMLRVNGSVIVSLPNASHPFSNSLLFADVTHKFIHTPMSLSQLLKLSGFQEITIQQIHSWSRYDDHVINHIIKNTVLIAAAWMGESFWRLVAFLQGIVLPECKPTLIASAR